MIKLTKNYIKLFTRARRDFEVLHVASGDGSIRHSANGWRERANAKHKQTQPDFPVPMPMPSMTPRGPLHISSINEQTLAHIVQRSIASAAGGYGLRDQSGLHLRLYPNWPSLLSASTRAADLFATNTDEEAFLLSDSGSMDSTLLRY